MIRSDQVGGKELRERIWEELTGMARHFEVRGLCENVVQ